MQQLLVLILRTLERYGEAVDMQRAVLRDTIRRFGDASVEAGMAHFWLAHMLNHAGRDAEAAAVGGRAVDILSQFWSADDPAMQNAVDLAALCSANTRAVAAAASGVIVVDS